MKEAFRSTRAEQLNTRHKLLADIESIEQRLRSETPDWEKPTEPLGWTRCEAHQPVWTVLELHNANDNGGSAICLKKMARCSRKAIAPTRFDAQFTARSNLSRDPRTAVGTIDGPQSFGGRSRQIARRAVCVDRVQGRSQQGHRRQEEAGRSSSSVLPLIIPTRARQLAPLYADRRRQTRIDPAG